MKNEKLKYHEPEVFYVTNKYIEELCREMDEFAVEMDEFANKIISQRHDERIKKLGENSNE